MQKTKGKADPKLTLDLLKKEIGSLMSELSLEDIEFIKILATSDATILQAGMNEATKTQIR